MELLTFVRLVTRGIGDIYWSKESSIDRRPRSLYARLSPYFSKGEAEPITPT